ncbi:MAG TPA: hypothetical protein P5052_00540 [Candidatus Paceibacterota bacterium]|nr:hypothetical protein [Candidatus Paceibacterota bacterium]
MSRTFVSEYFATSVLNCHARDNSTTKSKIKNQKYKSNLKNPHPL